MIKASYYTASIPITIPEPTARDLEIREAAATIARAERFAGRQMARDFGLTIEPKGTIYYGSRGGFSEPCTFGGGRLDEMLPGEAERIEERKKAP